MKAFIVLGVMLTSAMLIDPCLFAGDKGPPKPTLPKGTPAEQVKLVFDSSILQTWSS